MINLHQLRINYPVFTYENFYRIYENGSLFVKFKFVQSENIVYEPELVFKNCNLNADDLNFLDTAIFNLGMIELISYYKACCSPKIVIKAGFLSVEQIAFWKNIYFFGLGEFLFKNNIETSVDKLFEIVIDGKNIFSDSKIELTDGGIIPVGGGKDSVVSLEILSDQNAVPLILNPGKASTDSVNKAGYKNYFSVIRTIDPVLLELNKKGFLNGHTPFSALLAFVSAVVSLITKRKNIILSNENSANEGNAFFSGIEINHQYSKSFTAEEAMHDYISDYIHKEINYFSFLRPINELKIAQLFSRYKNHFLSFRSCNAGSKENIWCLKCPKCLFTFIILSPFLTENELKSVFATNLFEDISLEETFLELSGLKGIKPFECVGTVSEVNSALAKTICLYGNKELPYLLNLYADKNKNDLSRNLIEFNLILNEFNEQNLLDDNFRNILIGNL